MFTCPRAHTGSASHLHLYKIVLWHVQMGYCDHSCVCMPFGVSVACDGIRTGHFGSRTDCVPGQHIFDPYSDMSRYARDYGRASLWYNRDWAPPSKHLTKYSYSGWSKRSARFYPSDYDDRSRQWEDHKASGPAKENEGVPEAVVVAQVEAVDNRDKHQGRATDDSAAHTASAQLLGKKLLGRGWENSLVC